MNPGQGLIDGAFQRYFHRFLEFQAAAFDIFKDTPDIFKCWAKIFQQCGGSLPVFGKVRAEDEISEVTLRLVVADGFDTSCLEQIEVETISTTLFGASIEVISDFQHHTQELRQSG